MPHKFKLEVRDNSKAETILPDSTMSSGPVYFLEDVVGTLSSIL
jgi:hypothetical protein